MKKLSTLRCDMVTSFYHYNDVTNRVESIVRPTCGCLFVKDPTGMQDRFFLHTRSGFLLFLPINSMLDLHYF